MSICSIASFPRVLRVDLQRAAVYECGAAILAALTFPGPNEMQQRLEQRRGLRGYALSKLRAAGISETTNQPDSGYVAEALDEQTRAVEATQQIWNERLMAGQYAMLCAKRAFGQLRALRKPPNLPPDLQWAADVALQECDTWLDAPSAIDDRIWRESEPVIHVACALCVMMDMAWCAGMPMDIDVVLAEPSDPFILKVMVNLSIQYADLLSKVDTVKVDPGHLIRLTPFWGTQRLRAFAV